MKFNKKWLWLIIPILIISLVCLNASSVSTVLLAIQGAITNGNLVKFSGTNGIGVDTGLSATDVADAVTKKHSQNTDTDLDETFEATFVKKADTVNVLSDITSAGADIEDAVTKKHSQNTDTDLGTLTADVNMGTHKLTNLSAPSANGDSIRATTKITEANLESAVDHKDLTDNPHTVTKTQVGLSDVENLKVKLDGTQAPTVDNDIDEGYVVGSRWVDVTNDKEYVCLDNTDGVAVWIETTQSGDGVGTYLELTDTPAAYEDGKYAKSTADGVVWDDPAGAGDMLKATYDIDEDSDIDVAAGGTEKSAWTLYAIPYLSGTTAFGEIAIGTAEYCLTVNAGATGYDFTELAYNSLAGNPSDRITAGDKLTWDVDTLNVTETDPTVDTDTEIKAILVDEVIKTGDFTAGRMAIINNASGIIEQGTNTDTGVADAVTKKHSQNTDTNLILTNALGSDHTYSGEVDSQLVGESVVFGDLLYFNWTDKEWKKTDADAAATMPGLRIALETKSDGQTCLMLVKGYIRDDSAFEFAGSMVYTSVTPGAMSSTAPTETGDQIQRVGVAKSADILFFDPSIDVGEI